ncbi:hypothetical protein D1AOALGA4SA_8609 [Olavius algarvensis Delta 1 endosymbiont]|nr:hypothetical protein D1AOALGA4SA_8609 [Olavius algarvensis Delta 1 endosymbiont]
MLRIFFLFLIFPRIQGVKANLERPPPGEKDGWRGMNI